MVGEVETQAELKRKNEELLKEKSRVDFEVGVGEEGDV